MSAASMRLYVVFFVAGQAVPAAADVATDGTAGPRVQLSGDFEIGADLGTRAGGNLFHSFERFSLGAGERATFTGPDQIRRVISRVTGGTGSEIDGTLRSTIPGADFYFLNPAGIAFGPNARLDLQGSFHVSTADELRFADGTRFSATNPVASSFTVAAPEAFGFLRAMPRPLVVDRSTLEVSEGNEISLRGGMVVLSAAVVSAARGGIDLAAFGLGGPAPSTELPVGSVLLANGSLVDTSGEGGGRISIIGNEVVIGESVVAAANFGDQDSANGIEIVADEVFITAGSAVLTDSGEGAGDAGPITISGEKVTVAGDASLSASTFADGDAGVVFVRATDIAVLAGGQIGSDSEDEAGGAAGLIVLVAEDQLRVDGAGSGSITRVGTDTVNGASGPRLFEVGDQLLQFDAGTVIVSAATVDIADGGSVRSATFGDADAGTIAIFAEELRAVGRATPPFTGVTTSASTFRSMGSGGAGDILLRVRRLHLRDGAQVTSESLGAGPAGSITIENANEVVLDGAAAISTGAGFAGGGDIEVQARDLVLLRDGSRIGVDVLIGSARAGDIEIDPNFLILDKSAIGATADGGSGGRITITADNLILSPGSEITARAGPAGIDGTVVVSSPEVDLSGGLVVLEGALLDAASQLRERCGARRDIGASSFIGVGRGGLPASPDAPLASGYSGADTAGGETPVAAVSGPDDQAVLPSRLRLAGLAPPCRSWD